MLYSQNMIAAESSLYEMQADGVFLAAVSRIAPQLSV